MIRGHKLFICDDCGKTFIALDIEWNCTAFSCPATCPRCGSRHTYTSLLHKSVYKKIWAMNEENDKTSDNN